MHKCHRLVVGCMILPLTVSCQHLVSVQGLNAGDVDQLTLRAPFIFEGTISKTDSSTMQNLRVDDPSAVVTVNEVLRVPQKLGNYTDRNITVLIKDPVKDGERIIFFTEGLTFGRRLEVRELGRISSDNNILRDLTVQKIKDIPARLFRHHVSASELVVTGRVDAILSPPPDQDTQFVSEHYPYWRVAKISIASIEAGKYNKKTLLVPFPLSQDVMWRDRPKFALGQEGIWILHSNSSDSANISLFDAAHRSDFLPLKSLDFVRQQIYIETHADTANEDIPCVGKTILGTSAKGQSIQDFFDTKVTVVNMIPCDRGGESNQDSEPNLAVNPENPMHIAGSAFTPNPMEDEQSMMLAHIRSSQQLRAAAAFVPEHPNNDNGGNPNPQKGRTPIYVSTDGGLTWTLNPIIELTSTVKDITLRFSGRGGNLYAAVLEEVPTEVSSGNSGCPVINNSITPEDEIFVKLNDCAGRNFRMLIKRTADFTSGDLMTGGSGREYVDQPYIEVVTVSGRDGGDEDRVFVASNDLSRPNDSRTATIDRSLNGNNQPDGLYDSFVIEPSSPLDANGSGVRAAVHSSGTVYGVFYHFTGKSGNFNPSEQFRYTTDVIVVRDDNWAQGDNPFSSLVNPQNGTLGSTVANFRKLPIRIPEGEPGETWSGPLPDMGQERLVSSDISIAVNPRNKNHVYVAWADSDFSNIDSYTLHVRQSIDGGINWSQDLLTVAKAKNPALAINQQGVVGFLYQAFDDDNRRWITHLRRSGASDSWNDTVLANVSADTPPSKGHPYIGDYVHLMAINSDFYGVFSANNQPIPENFPSGVTYQRYVHFDGTLRASPVDNIVEPSIDPFFFKVTDQRFIDIPDDQLISK